MKTAHVKDAISSIRSKNAGPFWVTIDLFCANQECFECLIRELQTSQVAKALQADEQTIKRFEIPSLQVIKFSVPRPVVQGHRSDRDMHGAQWAILIEALAIQSSPKTAG